MRCRLAGKMYAVIPRRIKNTTEIAANKIPPQSGDLGPPTIAIKSLAWLYHHYYVYVRQILRNTATNKHAASVYRAEIFYTLWNVWLVKGLNDIS